MHIIINILLLSVVVFVVAQLLPKVKIKSFGTAVIVAIVYSVLSFLFGWILTLLSLPLILITFGLFKFVINAILLWVTDQFIEDFKIEGFGTTLIAAFLITIFDWILKSVL
jgi:putative membrane protein